MYSCIIARGKIYSFYFITLILFGNIVMLNLFLAILLGNFDKARQFWLKKKILEVFEKFIECEIPLSLAIDMILGDMSVKVKAELLAPAPDNTGLDHLESPRKRRNQFFDVKPSL
jgi:hypothetical protein